MDGTVRLAFAHVAVGIAVFILKYAAYAVTGSAALYPDAMESIVNIASAAAAFLAVRISAGPPDANHPTDITRPSICRRSPSAC